MVEWKEGLLQEDPKAERRVMSARLRRGPSHEATCLVSHFAEKKNKKMRKSQQWPWVYLCDQMRRDRRESGTEGEHGNSVEDYQKNKKGR